MIITPQGGADRRPGSYFMAKSKLSGKKVRHIPFEYSTDQAYIVEAGHQYMRFYKNHTQIQNGGSAYEIPTPYTEEDLFQLKYTQDENTMYIFHPSYISRKLRRINDTNWVLEYVYFNVPLTEANFGAYDLNGITYGKSKFVAVGANSVAATSLDGKTWQEQTLNMTTANGIACDNNIFVTVGNNGALETSPDGVTWTVQNSSFGTDPIYDVCHGNGLFLAVGANGKIATSPDGVNWTQRNSGFGTTVVRGCTFGNNLFIIVGGAGKLATSPDGITWTLRTSSFETSTIHGVCHGNNLFVAVGESGKIATSGDGSSWIQRTSGFIEDIYTVGYGDSYYADGYYVAGGDDGGLALSIDAINWMMKKNTFNAINGIAYGGDIFVAVGNDGKLATLEPKKNNFSGIHDHPSCAAFFEQRLIVAGTDFDPQTIWGSKMGDYENFILGTLDDDAFSFKIAANRANRIYWLISHISLLFGTSGGEWTMSGGNAPVTPSNVNVKRQSTYGNKNLQAELVNENVIFTQRAGKKLREYYYSRDTDSFIAPDLTILADHITESGIVCMALQQEPDTILWCVRNDGMLIGLTYEKQYGVFGWHRHITDGKVESVAIIPGEDEDEVWISVLRDDLDQKRYIEYFKPRNFGNDQTDCFFVDSGITFDGGAKKNISGATQTNPIVITCTAHGFSNDQKVKIEDVMGMTELNHNVYTVKNITTNTFDLYSEDGSTPIDGTGFTPYSSGGTAQRVTKVMEGLNHHEGKNVAVLVDGAAHPEKTVTSGQITLDIYGNKIHAGLPYVSKLKPQRLEVGGLFNTTQGKMKRIYALVIRFYKTLGCMVGPDEDNLQTILFRQGSDPMDSPPALFTGDKRISGYPGGWEKEGNILIVQDQPLPMNIVAIMPEMSANA